MQPIIIFKNEKQAYDCLFYWQRILNLQDWIIDIYLKYNDPVIAPAWGKSSIYRAIHTSIIIIPMPKPRKINNFAQRYIQELILVHELLHVVLPTIEVDVETTEGDYYEAEAHARLELLAKGFIMTRYDLDFDYFYNF